MVNLYPDIEGRVVNHVRYIELTLHPNTAITLSEIKKIFDRIKKEVWLNLPEKTATKDLLPINQRIKPEH